MIETRETHRSEGVLFVVGTPIGNREDITLRALEILKNAHLVAAEDTRHTGRLLEHYGLRPRLVSYHKFNERQRTPQLIGKLQEGHRIALVSSAGTPGVSDPGAILVRAAVAAGVRVSPIPGPSAAIAALSISGLETEGFVFLGFPPRKKGRRGEQLTALSRVPRALVWYESPQRVLGFLEDLIDVMGDRNAMVCRELTKLHEEVLRGTLSEIHARLAQREEIRGEVTVLIEGSDPGSAGTREAVREAIRSRLEADSAEDTNRIAKEISRQYGWPKNSVYDEVLRLKGKKD